eukprot:TRINITY_DN24049_c0_g1_i1.p1 TRINITY_DN24049_c0_g1~~TRINITY_DN24049_c0_g1_i1.p1  ORF type:complete len:656 (+),score=151.10 TRINITY_DN24049_c0_g1_i1:32-1999(+)
MSGGDVEMTEKPNVIDVGAGFVADVAIGGLRYVKETEKVKSGTTNPDVVDVLDRLEAHRGLGLGLNPREPVFDAEKIDGYPSEPRRGQQLYNNILDDIMVSTNKAIAELEREEKTEEQGGIMAAVSDWSIRDYRKRFLSLLALCVVLLAMWELSLKAIERDIDCSALNGQDGLSNCRDSKILIRTTSPISCNDFTCAAPWSPGPGSSYCTSCNCGLTCDRCEQCICTTGTGTTEHQVCRLWPDYPEDWGVTVRWIFIGVTLLVLCCGVTKWTISTVTLRSRLSSEEAKKEQATACEIRKNDLERIRQDIVGARLGGEGWKQEEPHQAFIRRMKVKLGDHDFQRIVAAGQKVGEVRGKAADVPGHVHVSVAEETTDMINSAKDTMLHDAMAKAKTDDHVNRTLGKNHPGRRKRSGRSSPEPQAENVYMPVDTTWLDANETEVVRAAIELYTKVHVNTGKEPTRRMLYGALEAGVPPAMSLTSDHLAELREVVDKHPEADAVLTEQEFAKEWLGVLGEALRMHFDPQSDEEEEEEAQRTNVNGAMAKAIRALGLGAEDESSSESGSEEENDATAVNAFVFSLPHLLSLIRGTPAPNKAQAAQQRTALLAAAEGLQELTGQANDSNVEDLESISEASEAPGSRRISRHRFATARTLSN